MEDITLANRPTPVFGANAAESSKSAVSWAAILSGAVVAAANARRYDASHECGFFTPEAL